MANRLKTPAADFPVPQSKDQADDFIRQIGDLQRQLGDMDSRMNGRIEDTKASFKISAQPIKEKLEGLTKGLQVFSEANRLGLTRQGKVKYHRFPMGEIKWRLRPPNVSLRGVEEIIKTLRQNKIFRKFLRTKFEVNKDAMRADPETAATIKGVTIKSGGEDFVITPNKTKIEEVLS